MWMLQNHGDQQERQAVILLRRGRFIIDGLEANRNIESRSLITPYLVAIFKTNGRLTNVRGLDPEDVEFRAVHERAFIRPAGELRTETVAAIIDTLREQIGLPEIDFEEPTVRSLSTIFHAIARHAMPLRF